jgi:2-dehydropantoate 2-reductase
MWVKLVFMASVSGVGAVSRSTFGEMRSTEETRGLLQDSMREVEAVGRARSVALPEGLAVRVMEAVDALPAEEMSSMQRDVLGGIPSELEALSGAVVRLGREAGVPTPLHAMFHAALLPQERRARALVH